MAQLNNTQNSSVKTFVDRFIELESDLQKVKEFKNQMEVATKDLMSMLTELLLQMRIMGEQLQAIYDLSEQGRPISRANVIEVANQRRIAAVRQMIDQDLKRGLLVPTDIVTGPETLVVYESDTVSLAFKAADGFLEEEITLEDLRGKRPGDVVKGIKIVELYNMNQQPQ